MVGIWKIGAWPGVWDSNTLKTKERYIEQYALPRGFAAIGYGWIPNIKKTSTDVIKQLLVDEDCGNIGRITNEILNFTRVIDREDVILLYIHLKVYVGIVKNPYYYVEKGSAKDFIQGVDGVNIAPHRIDVEWKFNKAPFVADFGNWRDTVHQVFEDDLDKISDIQLKRFLKLKLMQS
jgi:hypothetical protein